MRPDNWLWDDSVYHEKSKISKKPFVESIVHKEENLTLTSRKNVCSVEEQGGIEKKGLETKRTPKLL